VWFHIKTNDKLDPQAQEGTFIGYMKSRSQYLVLDQQRHECKVMSLVFLEGERGHISKKAGECNLATDDTFENALFDRNEAIPTTNDVEGGRNEVGVRFKEESQPAGLMEKENAGNGSMAKIPAPVLLAQIKCCHWWMEVTSVLMLLQM
jgi:hypothetical protein